MKDRSEWLAPDTARLGESLLSAAKHEQPSLEARERALVALGAGLTVGVASKTAAAAGAHAASGAVPVVGANGAGAAAASGAGAASSAAGGAALGSAGVASTGAGAAVVQSATGAFVAKWIGGGVVAGAVAFGAVQVSSDEVPVTVPADRGVADGQLAEATESRGQRAGEQRAVEHRSVAPEDERAAEPVEETERLEAPVAPHEGSSDEVRREPRSSQRRSAQPHVRDETTPRQGTEQNDEPVADGSRRPEPSLPFSEPERFAGDSARATEPSLEDLPSELREELRLIDQARTLVRNGAGASALRVLAEHQVRFSSGRMAPERTYLQMQAYRGLGRIADAQRVARQILQRYPRGPHAGSAKELLNQGGSGR